MVLLLAETPQGYALFKAKKSSLLKASAEEIMGHFEDAKSANKALALEHFTRFKDVKEATLEVAALQEGKIGDVLKKMIKKKIIKAGLASETLCVWDKNLMSSLKKKFGLEMILSPTTHEIFRGLKENLDALVADLGNDEQSRMMNMSLAHSLNRFKLKFSPEKIDIMVIQAIGLLDDLDKELNNLAMRLKEWYGFHFPELLKIVVDNSSFAKIVKQLGFKHNLKTIKTLKHIVPEEIEAQIRRSAETSMGSELVQQDLDSILELADRVIELSEYRQSLSDYLKKRMETIAPNLTYIVGEILAARLLAQAGSLMDLAKHPASTVQILGAEKALFRALKNKTNTPKYGLIFHAHLVGQSSPKFKGKMSRILANKIALCTRLDACGDQKLPSVAIGAMAYCERKLEEFSETSMTKSFTTNRTSAQIPQYVPKRLKVEHS